MPELPEVETVLRGLQAQLRDTPICDLKSYYPGTVIYDPDVHQPAFPARVTEYQRRGKYMILHLEQQNALIIHLRMTGKLIYTRGKHEEAKHIRAEFGLTDGCSIIFNDIRTFGKIILCPESKIGSYLAELGAEPLTKAFDAAYLQGKLQKKTSPIKTALLDQSIVAGLGNIYVCEILYRARIHPETPAKAIPLTALKSIVKHTKEVLTEAIAHNGTSVSDFRQIDDKTGEFQNFLMVYQKESCPAGHAILRIKQAGRSTFYCPLCQK
jgi:formamidopyrimidine-DNA glycosylase